MTRREAYEEMCREVQENQMSVLTKLKGVVCDEIVGVVGRGKVCCRHFFPGFWKSGLLGLVPKRHIVDIF